MKKMDVLYRPPFINHKLTHNMLSKQSASSIHPSRTHKPLSYSSFFTLCSNPEIPQNLPSSPKQKPKLLGKISIKQSKLTSLKLGSCRSLTSLPSQETVRYHQSAVFQHNTSYYSKNEQIKTNHVSSQVKDKPPTARFSLNVRSSEQQPLEKQFIAQVYDHRFNRAFCQQYSASQQNKGWKLEKDSKVGKELLSTLANSKDGKVFETFSSFAPPSSVTQGGHFLKKEHQLLEKSISIQNSIIFEPSTLNPAISHQHPESSYRAESSTACLVSPLSPKFSKPGFGKLSVRNVHSIHGEESTTSPHQSIMIQDFDSLMRKVRLNRLESWDVDEQFIEI